MLIIRRVGCINTTSGICYLHRVTYTICCIDTIDSPDDEHKVARNMYRIEIKKYIKGTVRQVGYLLELKMLVHIVQKVNFYGIPFTFINSLYNDCQLSHVLSVVSCAEIL